MTSAMSLVLNGGSVRLTKVTDGYTYTMFGKTYGIYKVEADNWVIYRWPNQQDAVGCCDSLRECRELLTQWQKEGAPHVNVYNMSDLSYDDGDALTADDPAGGVIMTTPTTSPPFAVGDRVVANRDLTNDMLVRGDEEIIVPKGAAGIVVGPASEYMRLKGFDLEVTFDDGFGWYVASDWLSPAAPVPVISRDLIAEIVAALELELADGYFGGSDYALGLRRALQIVLKIGGAS